MSRDHLAQTEYYKPKVSNISHTAHLTIFDGTSEPVEFDLTSFGKETVIFGRNGQNDIVLNSKYVSGHPHHGQFRFANGKWIIEDLKSTNGLIFNGKYIGSRVLEDGDSIRIDDGVDTTTDGVLMVFSTGSSMEWKILDLAKKAEITIGRDKNCNIRLNHISVSRLHAKIVAQGNAFYLIDNGSTNGVMVNGKKAEKKYLLQEKDLILITNSKLIFSGRKISYCCYKKGISVEALKIVKEVGKNRVICNSVDLSIQPCEMIAIVGGSGAGKSTVMNCLNGYSQPTKGKVVVNGVDLYENFDTLKHIIGYVPQSDIVYENLTVFTMLHYAAQLRLPKDVSESECLLSIEKVLKLVELTDHQDKLIKNLSGGQRKRASIAVELLSDPNLFFLDEPDSGLDPGTARNLMKTLQNMAASGKTVIFVTHSTLNLRLCDKIAFMGTGGNLCFYGSYAETLKFFGVDDIVNVYNLIANEPDKWKARYVAAQKGNSQPSEQAPLVKKSTNREWLKQIGVLCKRNLHILLNDRTRLLLIMLQAPLLAALIYFVSNNNQFKDHNITKSLLFALSCSAFWIGIFNSIQEVCKERNILKRECMAVLRLDTYIFSKMVVLSLVCAVQSVMLVSIFAWTVGLPEESLLLGAYADMLITIFLTTLAASAMGIFVSAFCKNADRAMTVAPLLMMPQLLFSGLIFKLTGISKAISYFTVCRWSMEGCGTIANLNLLDTITPDGMHIPREYEAFFEFTREHLLATWAINGSFIIIFALIAGRVLININKEKNA